MTVRFRSPFDEERVVPWLDYIVVEPEGIITVPDEWWVNFVAGGWAPLDPDPGGTPAAPLASTPSTPIPAAAPKPPAATPPATPAGSEA